MGQKVSVAIKNGMDWENFEFDLDYLIANGKLKTETDLFWPVVVTLKDG
jgi:hypothetical protein